MSLENIKYKVELLGKVNGLEEEKWQHFFWCITINEVAFDYRTGSGLVNKAGKPNKPELKDVLECLFMDYSAGQMSFNEFCSDFGYSNDSIKAFNIYQKCGEIGNKLRKALGSNFNSYKALFE